ncbi:redox-regulated ATPase YchF [candidate division KSB1 bacterium]|nr:redox-regulated ATPase YchF [candidate division KSB1 bacterium]RQW01335.1 MAG: redox-regulated ATPase YchF [candidate division KSB1 bacterium]
MKIGIVGLAQSGKTTLFNALTGSQVDTTAFSGKVEAHRAIVHVPDDRLELLNDIFQPKKKVPAIVEYIDLGGLSTSEQKKSGFSDQFLGAIRLVDAILVVVRTFKNETIPHPANSLDSLRDFKNIEAEFVIADLSIVENRMDRLQRQMKSKKLDADVRELVFLEKCQTFLEDEKPLRLLDMSDEEELIVRGYQFLTQKPLIVVVNIDEDDIQNELEVLKPFQKVISGQNATMLCIAAQIEMEIQQLSENEANMFLQELGISESAMGRLIRASYDLLGLLSFFTVGSDEVRAWTIKRGIKAPQAAGAIHTDFERGFIRAEVVHYEDFISRKSLPRCKTDGVLRLEGKDYIVKDGDIINFRFAV